VLDGRGVTCFACNLISSQGLADFSPLWVKYCALYHIHNAAPHVGRFADGISSTTEHFQYMTSEHIKLALSSTENSLGFFMLMPEQRGEKRFYEFVNSDVSREKKSEKSSTHPEVLMC